MNQYAQQKPPQWWAPKLSPFWIRAWRPLRRRKQLREQKLVEIEVRGAHHLRAASEAGHGVMVTPNHSSHADPYVMYHLADEARTAFYFLTAWQVFHQVGWVGKRILQRHGCFSIDREATDLKAFRKATEVLIDAPHPLVVFPEGEVYHINDRITPFREGAAAIAMAAARKAKRPVVCVPCGISYEYVDDPTDELLRLMDKLESSIHWRPRPDLPLAERIYRFAEGAMALKEVEYLGRTSAGPLKNRTLALAEHILERLELQYGVDRNEKIIPERVKDLRRAAIDARAAAPEGDAERLRHEAALDDLFLVVQLFSYPGDYVEERPSVERMAETLDKLEEDVLGVYSAGIRGRRRAIVSIGEPIEVPTDRKARLAIPDLTRSLESAVQRELDSIRTPRGASQDAPPEPARAHSDKA